MPRRPHLQSGAGMLLIVAISLALVALALVLSRPEASDGGNAGAVSTAERRECGDVPFRPNSDNGAFDVESGGVDCETARSVARAAEGRLGEPFSSGGFACTAGDGTGALVSFEYTCTRGGPWITFSVS